MKYLKYASIVLLIILIVCEFYGFFTERIFVFPLITYYIGIFKQCLLGKCVWFDKDTFDRVSG